MTVDDHKLSQMVMPQVELLFQRWFCCLSKLILPLGPDKQLLIWQRLFSLNLLVRTTRSSLLAAHKSSNTPSLSYFRCIALSRYLLYIVHRDFDHLSLPQNSTLVIYLGDIMLIGPGEQKVTTDLDILARHLHAKR